MAVVRGDRIGESKRLNRCSVEAQDFYAAMLAAEVPDDFGRFRVSPPHVAIKMYPRREPTPPTLKRIRKLMGELQEHGLWWTWEVDGVVFAELYNPSPRGNLFHRTPEPPESVYERAQTEGVDSKESRNRKKGTPHVHTKRCATTAIARAKEWNDLATVESLSLLIKGKGRTEPEQIPTEGRASVLSVPSVPSNLTEVEKEAPAATVVDLADWRRTDGRTLPQFAELVIAYAANAANLTVAEACRSWCGLNRVPPQMVEPIMAAIDRMPMGRDIPDDFGPAGEREVLISDSRGLVTFIAEREGLDPSEVVSEASEYHGHRYTGLERIPPNRHTRLVHTVNALRRWGRRLQGKPEPNARESPMRKPVGERTADTVRRMIARRTDGAVEGHEAGGEIHGGAGEAGRRLPAGDGRRDR